MTCCALHNMLLEVDGLDDEWQSGVKGDWEGDWGLHENEDSLKFAVPRDQDLSGFGGGIDQTFPQPDAETQPSHHDIRVTRKMIFFGFRSCLIQHFSHKWRAREIVWPSRNGDTIWQPSAIMRSQASDMGYSFS